MLRFDDTLTSAVINDINQGLIPMLLGEPGIGKSSWLENLAERMGTKCFTLACNQLADKADLTGARLMPVTDANGKTVTYRQDFFPHATIANAIAYAAEHPDETPILFLDELNRTTPDVTSEALSIPTMRSIGSTDLPDNLRVVIAGNDKGNITALDEASVSRFVLYRVEPDVQTFLEVNPDLNPYVQQVLHAHPTYLFGKALPLTKSDDDDEDNDDSNFDAVFGAEETMSQFTTPRTITALSRWLNATDRNLLVDWSQQVDPNTTTTVLAEMIEGHIGHTAFSIALHDIMLRDFSNTTTTVVAKPTRTALFSALENCTTRDQLNDALLNVTNKDALATMLYVVTQDKPFNHIIDALSPHVVDVKADTISYLSSLHGNGMLNENNLNTWIRSGTNVSSVLEMVLD